MARRDRKSWRPILEMSRPSMVIEPAESSTRRKSVDIILDLPAPVRPTTPIRSPPFTCIVRPESTSGRLGR